MPNDRLLLAQLDVSIRGLERSMRAAGISVDRASGGMEKRWNKMASRVEKRSNQMAAGITTAIAAIGLQAAGRDVANFADDWVDYGNKLAAASQVSGFAAASLGELQAGARDARSELSGYVDLYARILRSSDGVANSTEEVARVTNLASKAFAAGGAAAQEQAAGVLQLGQALGSGFLQGDELRSLRENAPLIAKAIADAFDVSIGGLKKLGAEGKLTSDLVFKALLDAAPDIEAAFGATIPRATEEARRAMDDFKVSVGEYLVQSGALEDVSRTFADTLNFVSTNVDVFAKALVVAAAAAAGLLGASGLVAVSAGLSKVAVGATTAAKAMAVLRAATAFLLGPAGFVIAVGAASAAIAAFLINGTKFSDLFNTANRAIDRTNELLAETEIYVNRKPIGKLGEQADGAIGAIESLTRALGEYNEALEDSLTLNLINQIAEIDAQIANLENKVAVYKRQIELIGTPITDSDVSLVSELNREMGLLSASLNGLKTRKGRIALEIFGEGRGKAVLDAIFAGDLAGAVAIIEGSLDEIVNEVSSSRSGGGRTAGGGGGGDAKAKQKAFNDLLDGTNSRYDDQLKRLREELTMREALAEYEYDTQLELARASGQEDWIARLEREEAVRERIAALRDAGITGPDALARANEEQDAVDSANKNRAGAEAISEQREAFRDVFSGAVQDAMSSGDVGSAIKNVFADRAADGLKSALDNLADVIFDLFKSIDFGGGGGGGGSAIGNIFGSLIKGRANGGSAYKNSLYRVGEGNKPEMFKAGNKAYLIPGENGMVSPLRGLDSPMANGGYSIDNSVVIQGSITEDVWPRVQAELRQRDRSMASQMATTARAVYAKDRARGRM